MLVCTGLQVSVCPPNVKVVGVHFRVDRTERQIFKNFSFPQVIIAYVSNQLRIILVLV